MAGSLTTPPAVELGLQPRDGVFQRLVLFSLFLPLALPLLCCQLHIHTHRVLHRLCPGETGEQEDRPGQCPITSAAISLQENSPHMHAVVINQFIFFFFFLAKITRISNTHRSTFSQHKSHFEEPRHQTIKNTLKFVGSRMWLPCLLY